MGIGGSILLIAVGAILRWAVEFDVAGVEVGTVGAILMVVGVIGLIASAIYMRRGEDLMVDRRDYGSPREIRSPYM